MSDLPRPPVESHHRRALGITSFALGAALGLAWALADVRTAPLPLGPRIAPKGWPISFCLPAGWKHETQDADAWSGEIEAHPAAESEGLRLTIRHDRRLGEQTESIIRTYLIQRYADGAAAPNSIETASVGPLAGVRLGGDRLTANMIYPFMIAAAGLPDGPAIVVEISARSGGQARLRRTLASVCESIEFVRPRLSRSLGELSGKAGLECTVPPGLWCVDESSLFRTGVGFAADSGSPAPWSARVWRTFLAPPRTLSDLVTDAALAGGMRFDLPDKPNTSTLAGKPAAGVTHTEQGVCRIVWAVDLGNSAVALIRAIGPESLATEIDAACRKMAETARLRTSANEFDVTAALKAGDEAVAAVRRRGLAAAWGDGAKSVWYLFDHFGDAAGYLYRHRERETSARPGGKPDFGYSGTDEFRLRFPDTERQTQRTVWTTDDDAVAFTSDLTLAASYGDKSQSLITRMSRTATDDEVEVTASSESRKRTARIKVGEAFASDPLEELAIREVGERGVGHEALIRMLDDLPFSAHYVRCRVERGPDGDRRIRTQCDFSPVSVLYAFDDDGELARLTQREGVLLRRVKHAEVARSIEWLGKDDPPPAFKEDDE